MGRGRGGSAGEGGPQCRKGRACSFLELAKSLEPTLKLEGAVPKTLFLLTPCASWVQSPKPLSGSVIH